MRLRWARAPGAHREVEVRDAAGRGAREKEVNTEKHRHPAGSPGPSPAADRATRDNSQSVPFWFPSAGIEHSHLISSQHLNSKV